MPKPEEAFTLPIPVELTAKQQQQMASISSNPSAIGATTPTAGIAPNQSFPTVAEPPLSIATPSSICKYVDHSFIFLPFSNAVYLFLAIVKPSIDVLRIDQRVLTHDSPIRPQRIKTEPLSGFTCITRATDLQKMIKHSSSGLAPLPVSYLPDGHIPAPPPAPKQSMHELNPAAPSVLLETRREATSIHLQQYCFSQPICIVRGLANVLKLDLGLFSTKTLVESHPDHSIEVRTQRQQASDENFDFNSMTSPMKNVWNFQWTRSYTTITKYAQYQAFSYHDMIKDEINESNLPSIGNSSAIAGHSTTHLTNGTGKKAANKQPSMLD